MTCDTYHLTCDTLHLPCYTWHLTCDMWHMTFRGWWTLSQNFRILALTAWEWRSFKDIFTKDDSLSDLINHDGVCRTALATPGMLTRPFPMKLHQQAMFAQYGKITVIVEPMIQFYILQNWDCPKAVQHSLFYSCVISYCLGGAVRGTWGRGGLTDINNESWRYL